MLRRLRPVAAARPLPGQVTRGAARGRLDRRAVAPRRGADPALEQLPVTVESWDAFDRLFDWRVAAGGGRRHGDLRDLSRRGGAPLLRAGRPARDHRARRAIPGRSWRPPAAARRIATARIAPRWCRGFGDRRAALRCHRSAHVARHPASLRPAGGQPRLPARSRRRLRAAIRAPPDATLPLVPISEGFVECSDVGSAAARRSRPCATCGRHAATRTALPPGRRAGARPGTSCFATGAMSMLIGALPLMASAAAAVAIRWSYLAARRTSLVADGADAGSRQQRLRAARYPWLSTRASADLPQLLEPPDGLLAGLDRGRRARARHLPLGRRHACCPRSSTPSRSLPGASAPTHPWAAPRRARLPRRAPARRLGAAVGRHDLARLGVARRAASRA